MDVRFRFRWFMMAIVSATATLSTLSLEAARLPDHLRGQPELEIYAGAPVRLHLGADMEHPEARLLGPSISEGMRPQEVVPAGIWQMAESMGPWSLVGCTVAPAFSFDAFEIAAAD